nr:MAG TPA: hypothetical protein [Caudoviricetes sp.]
MIRAPDVEVVPLCPATFPVKCVMLYGQTSASAMRTFWSFRRWRVRLLPASMRRSLFGVFARTHTT